MRTHRRVQNGQEGAAAAVFIYARRRDGEPTDPLVLLPDGHARQMRAETRANLMCPVPGCRHPELTTVSRNSRRDGFRHLAGTTSEHAPESYLHEYAKNQIARAVMDRHPDIRVRLEESTHTRERRADVMLTFPDGRQVAVEVQYANLSVADWRTRHDSYRTQSIHDIWLFGTSRVNATRGTISRSPELEIEALREGVQTFWIDPEAGTIAVPNVRKRLPVSTDESFNLWIRPLTELDWTPDGLFPELWLRAVAATNEHLREEAAAADRLHRERERIAAEQEAAKKQAAANQQAERDRERAEYNARRYRELLYSIENPDSLMLSNQGRVRLIADNPSGQVRAQWDSILDAGVDLDAFILERARARDDYYVDVAAIVSDLVAAGVQVVDVSDLNALIFETLKPLARDGTVTIHPLDSLLQQIAAPGPRQKSASGRRTKRDCVVCGLPLADEIRIDRHPVPNCDRP